jgi:hypothetical protein
MTTTPRGWRAGGRAPQDYELGSDAAYRHSGKRSAVIRARVARPADYGTLMQECLADDYRNQRVRLRAWIRVAKVEGWCALWMRVDDNHCMLACDEMKDRPIRGSADWTAYDVVLDVPARATSLAYGVLLHGAGTVWFDDLSLTAVGPEVALTNVRSLPRAPVNLDFEDEPEKA